MNIRQFYEKLLIEDKYSTTEKMKFLGITWDHMEDIFTMQIPNSSTSH